MDGEEDLRGKYVRAQIMLAREADLGHDGVVPLPLKSVAE